MGPSIKTVFELTDAVPSYVDAKARVVRSWESPGDVELRDGLIGYLGVFFKTERKPVELPLLETIADLRDATDEAIAEAASQLGPLCWFRSFAPVDGQPEHRILARDLAAAQRPRRGDDGQPIDPKGLYEPDLDVFDGFVSDDDELLQVHYADRTEDWRDFASTVARLLEIYLSLWVKEYRDVAILKAIAQSPNTLSCSSAALAGLQRQLGADFSLLPVHEARSPDHDIKNAYWVHQPNTRRNRWLHPQHVVADSPEELAWAVMSAYVSHWLRVGPIEMMHGPIRQTDGSREWDSIPIARSLVGATALALSARFTEMAKSRPCKVCKRAVSYKTKPFKYCNEHQRIGTRDRQRRSRRSESRSSRQDTSHESNLETD